MKKIYKILITIITILLLLFLINFVRNYFILKIIYNAGNSFNQGDNYKIQEKINTSHSNDTISIYYLNNKYLYEEKNDKEEYIRIIFQNLNNNEYSEFISNASGTLTPVYVQEQDNKSEYIKQFIYCKNYKFSDLLKNNIFKIIKKDNECYIINISNQYEYINKKNGLLTKIKSSINNIDIEIIFEKNVVDEKNFDINQYFINS